MSEYGQINETTERWKLIQKTIKDNNFKKIVEIGTWKGLGSTKCILEIIDDDCEFISIESNHVFYKIAEQNLKDYLGKFKLLLGTIVNESEVFEFVNSIELNTQQKIWLEEDINNINKCKNLLDSIPNQIDFLLLDGGEFSTYPEWKKLKERTKIVALDDILEVKTSLIHHELSNDKNYELLEKTQEGNGFSIFKKIL
jgi:hypothetical protein